MNADHAGAIICEVLWNQELVLETVIQLIFLGLCISLVIVNVIPTRGRTLTHHKSC